MNFMEWVDLIDTSLFLIIHRDSNAAFLDQVIPLVRNPVTWIPLYLYMIYFTWRKLKSRAILFIVLTIVTIILCDQLSAGLFKPLFSRLRPCSDPDLQPLIRNVIACGGRYSFPSSHAANHFGLACFWYYAIRSVTGRRWNWLWIWALCICYAQVYVGKHYPLDIAAGALLGVMVGTLSARIFENWHLTGRASWFAPVHRNSLEN